MKKFLSIMTCMLLVVVAGVGLMACGKKEKPLYNISFKGNVEGEKYDVAPTTWTKSEEKGFEAVYTLTGEVAYDKATADALGYTDGRTHFALIRFTSDKIDRVSHNKETGEGFYAKIINFYGTDNQAEPVIKTGGFGSGNEETKNTTYFLYQGVDETVRTLTVEINFDGVEGNERLYKFVIDPENYTLAPAPQA